MKIYAIKSKKHNLGVPRAPKFKDASTDTYYNVGDYVAVTQEQLDLLKKEDYELLGQVTKPTKRKKKSEEVD